MDKSNLPESWSPTPLAELLSSMESGSRPRGGVRGISEGVPSVGGEHLNAKGGFDFASIKYVPRSFYMGMRRGHIRRGDILIVKDGATTGKVAIVRRDFPFDEAVVNEHVFVCRPGDIDGDYLFWFLHSSQGQRGILEHFKGSAQGGITTEFAAGTLIPVAPPPTQRAIAELLDATHVRGASAQEHLSAAREAVDRFRQAVLVAACSGRLTANWRQSHAAAAPAESIVTSLERARANRVRHVRPQKGASVEGQSAALPETWCWTSIGALADVATGATPLRTRADYYGGSIPWVTSGAVNAGLITSAAEFITDLALKETSTKVFPKGTLLVAMYGEGQTRGRVAELGIDAATNQAVAALLFDRHSAELRPYVRLFLLENYERIRRLAFGGVQPNLSLSVVRETPVPLPPSAEQVEIIHRVDVLMRLATFLTDKISAVQVGVERTSQGILSKAFRGDLVIVSNGNGATDAS